jgi:hypothetical protein
VAVHCTVNLVYGFVDREISLWSRIHRVHTKGYPHHLTEAVDLKI